MSKQRERLNEEEYCGECDHHSRYHNNGHPSIKCCNWYYIDDQNGRENWCECGRYKERDMFQEMIERVTSI